MSRQRRRHPPDRDATADEEGARRAYAAIHTYTLGFAALEASRSGWELTEGASDGLANQLAAYTSPTQFAEGLRYLPEGIDRQEEDGRTSE